jgi:hypothetical protein
MGAEDTADIGLLRTTSDGHLVFLVYMSGLSQPHETPYEDLVDV